MFKTKSKAEPSLDERSAAAYAKAEAALSFFGTVADDLDEAANEQAAVAEAARIKALEYDDLMITATSVSNKHAKAAIKVRELVG